MKTKRASLTTELGNVANTLGIRPQPVQVRVDNLTLKVRLQKGPKMTSGGQGISIADACVASLKKPFQSPQSHEKVVLDSVNLVADPGSMTLILGPPQCGKTTLLKAIAGQYKTSQIWSTKTGTITFNSDDIQGDNFCATRVATYVDQTDTHMKDLTVRETLDFAFQCLSAGTHSLGSIDEDKAKIAQYDQQNYKVKMILEIFGLQTCADTPAKNISGGERKRLTFAEMLMGNSRVYLGDEVSTGLDSSTTFDIMKALRASAKALGISFIITLLQPTPEVVALFDQLLLLASYGTTAYLGPATEDSIASYFYSAGFFPHHALQQAREGTGSHEGSAARQAAVPMADWAVALVAGGGGGGAPGAAAADEEAGLSSPGAPAAAADFKGLFERSELHRRVRERLRAASAPAAAAAAGAEEEDADGKGTGGKEQWFEFQRRPFHRVGIVVAARTCLIRQMKLIRRDTVFLRSQIVQTIISGLIAGSLFYQLELTDTHSKFGALFFSLMTQALGGFAALPAAFECKAVLQKHQRSLFYPAIAYCLGQTVASLPLVVTKSTIFGALVYWMAGLSATDGFPSQFFLYIITLVLVSLVFNQFLQLLIGLVRDEKTATSLAGLVTLAFVLFSGFIINFHDIPIWWIWLYWANPVSWGLRALAVNEFMSAKYKSSGLAVVVLDHLGFSNDKAWIWISIIILGSMFLLQWLITVRVFQNHLHKDPIHTTALVHEAGQEESTSPPAFLTQNQQEATVQQQLLNQLQQGALSAKPVTLSFENLWYSVPARDCSDNHQRVSLLKGVSGYCRPGRMTALMGSSGAGKTTLLDVMSGRSSGGILSQGQVYVNGTPVHKQSNFRQLVGYVEQNDIHSPYLTVLEALKFSSQLRLPLSVTQQEKETFVSSILSLLELDSIKDNFIGSLEEGGLSLEQRKRLTIGVEMAANPAVLFLDEPTSGLDARAAEFVMKLLSNLIKSTGKTAICTIHQPSHSVFELFDDLLLLKRGGETVFFGPLGPNSSRMVSYLSSIPGTPALKYDTNPATWMLECIGAGTKKATNHLCDQEVDFVQAYQSSCLHQQARQKLDEFCCETSATSNGNKIQEPSPKYHATPLPHQFKVLAKYAAKRYWRSPNCNLQRVAVSIIVAIVLGSNFVGSQVAETETSIISSIGLVFLTTIFVGLVYFNGVVPVVAAEKAVFSRERASAAYGVIPYNVAWGLVEIPYLCIGSLIFVAIFYFMVGFEADLLKFFYYYLFFLLYVSFLTFFGQFCAAVLPNPQTASLVGSLMTSIFTLFAGFLIPPSLIPTGWKFLYYLNPMHYALEGIAMTQYHGTNSEVSVVEISADGEPYVVRSSAEVVVFNFFGGQFEWNNRFWDLGVLLLFIAAIRLGTSLAFRFMKINRS